MTKQELLAEGLQRVSHAARHLGIHRGTVYEWIKQGKIPYTRINGVYRVPTRAVTAMLEQGLHLGTTPDE